MNLKSISKIFLAITLLIGGGVDTYAQKKTTAKKKTAATSTVKKNYPPLSEQALNEQTIVCVCDLGEGNLVKASIYLDFSDLSIYMSGAELGGRASVSGNTLTITSGGLVFTLTSNDGGYHFTGTLKDTRRNKTCSLNGYLFAPKPDTITRETCKALLKGEYAAFIDVYTSDTEPQFYFPVTLNMTVDPNNPYAFSYKIKGESKIMPFLGSLKGEMEFNENNVVYTAIDDDDFDVSYEKRNKYSIVFYLGDVNIPRQGRSQVFLYLMKKTL